ncbi:RNA chaperone ProQ [Flocculibacter collagenilyticus]|uniref:RNA chaperone ProQ n=1 Tax=Flocculibacter collagenilyticus TaxID=2744479 RepID=UPI0018F76856|nr:RNA chaperone ProQ [Flocculibacter collagenilyticus]
MDDNQKLKDVNEVLTFLSEKFPQCFTLKGKAKPLKIGIFKEIAEKTEDEPKVSRTQLRQALRRYTASWRYLECVKEGEHRINLEGEQCEKVEAEHAEHAAKALKESKERYEQRKKENAAKRNEKKSYKNSASKTGTVPPKGAKSKKRENAPAKVQKKTVKPQVELSKLDESLMKVGTKVHVKLGKSPMKGTITEVAKDDIHVQLDTGMVVKTRAESLFTA